MRYHVTSGETLYADFIDSGEAHRYARQLSRKIVTVVRVRRIEVIRPALTCGDEGVYYERGWTL